MMNNPTLALTQSQQHISTGTAALQQDVVAYEPGSLLPFMGPTDSHPVNIRIRTEGDALTRAAYQPGSHFFKRALYPNFWTPGQGYTEARPIGLLARNGQHPYHTMEVDLAARNIAEDVYKAPNKFGEKNDETHYVTYEKNTGIKEVDGHRSWKRLNDKELKHLGLNPALFKDRKGRKKTGFKTALYRSDNGEYILAFAGTEPTADAGRDLWTDVKGGSGLATPEQMRQAGRAAIAAKRKLGDNLVITGHSLGGGLATFASVASGGTPSVGFNPMDITDTNYREAQKQFEQSRLSGPNKTSSSANPVTIRKEALATSRKTSRQYVIKGEFVDKLQSWPIKTPDFGVKIELKARKNWKSAYDNHLWPTTGPLVEKKLNTDALTNRLLQPEPFVEEDPIYENNSHNKIEDLITAHEEARTLRDYDLNITGGYNERSYGDNGIEVETPPPFVETVPPDDTYPPNDDNRIEVETPPPYVETIPPDNTYPPTETDGSKVFVKDKRPAYDDEGNHIGYYQKEKKVPAGVDYDLNDDKWVEVLVSS